VTAYRTILSLAAILVLAATPLLAQDKGETGFVNKVFKGKDGDSKYVLFVPHDYKGDKEYPLILFLHGAGERGDDGKAPVKQGIGNAIKFKGGEQKFPAFVIFPQCAKGGSWKAGGSDADRAPAMLDEVQKQYKIGGKRIYLTGLSMGGAGTWSLAAAYQDRWAAVAPICGGGDPANASKLCGDLDGKRRPARDTFPLPAMTFTAGLPLLDATAVALPPPRGRREATLRSRSLPLAPADSLSPPLCELSP
jgi:poly(3-hydroxybutyrate) depolymerase